MKKILVIFFLGSLNFIAPNGHSNSILNWCAHLLRTPLISKDIPLFIDSKINQEYIKSFNSLQKKASWEDKLKMISQMSFQFYDPAVLTSSIDFYQLKVKKEGVRASKEIKRLMKDMNALNIDSIDLKVQKEIKFKLITHDLSFREINNMNIDLVFPLGVNERSFTTADNYLMNNSTFFIHDFTHAITNLSGLSFLYKLPYSEFKEQHIKIKNLYQNLKDSFGNQEDLFHLIWFFLAHEKDFKINEMSIFYKKSWQVQNDSILTHKSSQISTRFIPSDFGKRTHNLEEIYDGFKVFRDFFIQQGL